MALVDGAATGSAVTGRKKRKRVDRNANGIPDADERRQTRSRGTTNPEANSDPARPATLPSVADSGLKNAATNVPPMHGMDTQTARTAFGKQFTPDMGLDVFANPEVAATQFMRNQGMDPMRGGGMTKVMNDLAQVMPDLFFLTQGTGVKGAGMGLGAPSFLDFAGQFLNGQSTPGGGFVSPDIIGNLFGKQDSPLNAFLNDPNADAATQISRLIGMMGAGLQTTIPPQILQAILGTAQQSGTDYMADQATGKRGGTFADALKKGTSIDEWFNF